MPHHCNAFKTERWPVQAGRHIPHALTREHIPKKGCASLKNCVEHDKHAVIRTTDAPNRRATPSDCEGTQICCMRRKRASPQVTRHRDCSRGPQRKCRGLRESSSQFDGSISPFVLTFSFHQDMKVAHDTVNNGRLRIEEVCGPQREVLWPEGAINLIAFDGRCLHLF